MSYVLMNKKISLVLLVGLPLLLGISSNENPFNIYGVKGNLLTNIQARFSELNKTISLSQETDEELRSYIAKAMQPYGYFRPQINISRQPLRIAITAGPQMLVSNLQVMLRGEGAQNLSLIKLIHHFPLQQGKPLDSAQYEEAKQRLVSTAETQGYLHSSFERAEMLIDLNYYRAQIVLLFNTGPQYYFGQVKFDPTYISPELFNRYLPFHYGQPYSTEQILTLNNYLTDSGYFSNVVVKPRINSQRYIPVDVHLQRTDRINYSLGLGYGTDTGIRGRAGMHIVPVNRAGHKFSAVGIGARSESSLQAQYVIPGQNPITDQYNISTNLANMNYSAGYSDSVLASFAQQHTLSNFQRVLSINTLYERFHYSSAPKIEKLSLYPRATFTWSNTTNKLFSPNGYNVTINGLAASRAVLSGVSFAQAAINAKAALTLPAIRTRLYFHTIHGITHIANINELPLSLALLLGGADNLKGYSYNSLGPGKILSYGGLEIQKETVDNWYFLGFFDSGDVYVPSLKDLQNDVGVGLMWVSPIGPIKIGIAQAINSHFNRIRERKPKLVISMGPDL
jgi:translocation and assembly module TamA